MTPPPSLFRKNKLNHYLEDYSNVLKHTPTCAVWDLLGKVGGITAPRKNSFSVFMAKDKVHYTREGYEMQGSLFAEDFLSLYNQYVKHRDHWIQ